MSNMRQLGFGVQAYANQFYGALPEKGPDGSDRGPNSFTKLGGVRGYDDPSPWFNAIPPLINSKSYYEMLVDDSRGITLPYAGGPASIFICPIAGAPASYNSIDIVFGNYYLLWGTDSSGAMKISTGLAYDKQFKFCMSYVLNSKLASSTKYGNQKTIKIEQRSRGRL